MTRWLIAFTTVLLLGAALWPIKAYRGDPSGATEILAYELSMPQGVSALVAGGTEEIVMTSWLVVPQQKTLGPLQKYSYQVHASIALASGEKFLEQHFEIGSRISGNPAEPISGGKFAARLAESDEWVTDGRTTRLNVSELGNRAAKMRVWAPRTAGSLVLVRLSYEEPRGNMERAILERTLLPEQRRRVVGNSAALGFADLPNAAREKALATWGRRLTAEGRSGRDFAVRRLLIGSYRTATEDEETSIGFDVGPHQRAILNLRGRTELGVDGPEGATVLLQDDDATPISRSIGKTGRVRLPLPVERPRSAALWSESPTRLRFWLPGNALGQLLGKPGVTASAGQLEVMPDSRYQRFWRLDPQEALRYEIAEGQALFGFVLRGIAEPGARDATVAITAKWEGSAESATGDTLRVTLPVVGVESAQGFALSEPERSAVIPPKGATVMLLTGTAATAVSVWVPEPFAPSSVPDPAYPQDLGKGRAWRDAPFEQRATAIVLPDRVFELAKTDRSLSVRVQPRIANVAEGPGKPVAERVPEPASATTTRRIYRQAWHVPGSAFPENGWLLLRDQSEKVIAVAGPKQGTIPFLLVYRTCAVELGEPFRVLLDGEPVVERRLAATAGSLALRAPAGQHRLEVTGIGQCGSALAAAAPATSGPILKRQLVHELVRGSPLRIPFARRAGELLSVILVIVSEGKALPYTLNYRFVLGGVQQRMGVFLRRLTTLEGTLVGTTGGQERTNLWETGAPLSDRGGAEFLGTEHIALGNDLAAGTYELVLRSSSRTSLWIRAILAGRVIVEPGSTK